MSGKKTYEKPLVNSRTVALGVYGEYSSVRRLDTDIQPAPTPPLRHI